MSILTQWLEYKQDILVWGVPKTARSLLGPGIELFHKERIKRKVRMLHIYNYEATERMKLLGQMPFTPVRRLSLLYDSAVATNVCADEVMWINFNRPITIYRIKDPSLADSMKKYFEILWKQAQKP